MLAGFMCYKTHVTSSLLLYYLKNVYLLSNQNIYWTREKIPDGIKIFRNEFRTLQLIYTIVASTHLSMF